MENEILTILDYLLVPFYMVAVYLIANKIRDTQYPPGHPWRPYFIPGLTAKIVGAIGIGLIYKYYYGGGDTFNYFYHAKVINSSFSESSTRWYNLLFRIPPWYDGDYSQYISKMWWYDAPSEYLVASITAALGIFTFTTYLPTCVLFAVIGYSGIWALFKTFASKYPDYTRYIAWSVLFIPSTIMWGSGIFKDTICMGCLGWLTYCSFRLLINRDFSVRNIIILIISFYLILSVKIYILLAFVPALVLWIFFTYSHKIQSSVLRTVMKIFVLGICIGGFLFFSQQFASSLGKYSLENVAKTSYTTNSNIHAAAAGGDAGSAYDLGPLDPSLGGMLKKFPAAVNVSLFRPYLWETRKPFQMLSAIEALLFLWVTIKILWRIGPRTAWRTIGSDPTIQFCLIFAIVFAFAVGLSSGTFGTLSRYRIPCLPFYAMALVLIYYKNEPIEKNIISFKK